MSTVTVSTTTELLSALAKAQSGDTILINPGNYSAVTLQNLTFPGGVTIASADPANPAVFSDLLVRNSSGLSFSNIEMDASGSKAYYPFQVLDSSNVHFSKIYVHGSLDGSPHDDMSSFMIRNSSNVSVVNSEFEQLQHGINFLDSEQLHIEGNSFHDLRIDGIRGGGSSYVTITGNSFTDFYPMEGDHGDAVQFWTTNTTASAHHIVVTDNLITRGNGGIVQGIFFRDQVGGLRYDDILISGNMVAGTMWNGIYVQGATNVSVLNNVVAGYPDQKSWVRLDDVTGATVTGNSAGDFLEARVLDVVYSGSIKFLPSIDEALKLVEEWKSRQQSEPVTESRSEEPDTSGWILGGTDDDKLAGTSGNDTLDGRAGNDTLAGDAGDDILIGGDGADTLAGGTGADTLTGGSGNDIFLFASGDGRDLITDFASGDLVKISGYSAAQSITQVGGNVVVVFSANDAITFAGTSITDVQAALQYAVVGKVLSGNNRGNTLNGGAGNDTLKGMGGNDKLSGQGGDDLLEGGAGADSLKGDDGNDILRGGTGNDTLTGGAGADLFQFEAMAGADKITDFQAGVDKIDFSLLGITASDVSQKVGKGGLILTIDANHDGRADFTVTLANVKSLAESDFIFREGSASTGATTSSTIQADSGSPATVEASYITTIEPNFRNANFNFDLGDLLL